MSWVEEQVIEKIVSRAAIGEAKYGVTMAREDLSLKDWLTHLQEELLDASLYVEKLIYLLDEFSIIMSAPEILEKLDRLDDASEA